LDGNVGVYQDAGGGILRHRHRGSLAFPAVPPISVYLSRGAAAGLAIGHVLAALVMASAFVRACVPVSSTTVPLQVSYESPDSGRHEVDELTTLRIGVLVPVFTSAAAVFHVMHAASLVCGPPRPQSTSAVVRGLEFVVVDTLVVALIGFLVGVFDLKTLLSVWLNAACHSVFRLIADVRKSKLLLWLSAWPLGVAWMLVWWYYGHSVRTRGLGAWVGGVTATAFAVHLATWVHQDLSMFRVGCWRNRALVEWGYLGLAVTSRATIAYIAYAYDFLA